MRQSIFKDKWDFKKEYIQRLTETYGKQPEHCTEPERYTALVSLIVSKAAAYRRETDLRNSIGKRKAVYYFSMEFLIGRLLRNYLINFGIEQLVEEGLAELGTNLESLCRCEADPGLGNGGLGRLAACFLDAMPTQDINAAGMGIRFRFGLFRQQIVSGWQTEQPDDWLEDGYPWETKKPAEAVIVQYGTDAVKAMPYDVPVVGYGGERVNVLRLWRALPARAELDLPAFNQGDYSAATRSGNDAEAISCILYPDDSTEAGKRLRLRQEYFFCSAGLQSILRKYRLDYGTQEWDQFPERVSIHINDTHPTLCIPELMRLLMDECGLEWDEAWRITTQTVSYTNHTVLPEALEKWPIHLFEPLLPRIYAIIKEIDRRYTDGFDRFRPNWQKELENTAVLWDGQVRMACLSVIGSRFVNGVAGLHTEILKRETLADFYRLTPEKFQNKTNGVAHRRFLLEANPGLASLITEAIGEGWITDAGQLEKLLPLQNDPAFLQRLQQTKRRSKIRLARVISERTHIGVDVDSVFDVQVKRIHAYKRQLLNVFKVMDLYNRLKDDPNADVQPTVFVFSGKAAQSYVLAKEIIKLICSVADMVNADPAMHGRLAVVFLENLSVSLGQYIYPAADLSEQISTAGKEASGTGNMKFMFNGALTIGTLDGANVEIRDCVGEENMFLFGLKAEEAAVWHQNGYNPAFLCQQDYRLARVTSQLINGTFLGSGWNFNTIYDDLLRRGDEYLVLQDFADYVATWEKAAQAYRDRSRWNKMSLVNIAKAGFFSADRTIAEYNRDIWNA